MAEEVRVSKRTATALVLILLMAGFVAIYWEDISEWFGGINVTSQPPSAEKTVIIKKEVETRVETPTTTPPKEEKPHYQLSEVNIYLMDALDTDNPISGETIYVYKVGVNPADPNVRFLDSDTTDSNGLAQFTAGVIETETDYQYVLKGSNVYDVVETRKVPAPSSEFAISSYTFPEAMYAYKVGSFLDMGSDLTVNLTTDTGIRSYSFDIQIGEADAGEVVKEPVLILRQPEGMELATGCIRSIYFIHASGSNLGLPLGDVSSFIDKQPIVISGQTKPGFLTVNDVETVTVRIETDNSLCVAGSALDIVLDDLGGYRARDVASLKLGASAESVRIAFVA